MLKLYYSLILVLFSSSVFAETYACSLELSRWDRPGEVETKTYQRMGEKFVHNRGWDFYILIDSQERLLLMNYGEEVFSIFTVMIDKTTLEFTEDYMSIADSKEYESEVQDVGKCILLND